ncbi:MAG: glycoside hydrolase N-terminal domain-containing protein [Verrucomicrobia bacterium]|nr:glycoside hydrolase N-terminal domain-containing protein [Verrucomicrobiota bacterium]
MKLTKPTLNSKRHDLHLAAPIDRWDEAIPLGNGLMGVLLWGSGRHLKLSLDRGDLWDLRVPEEFKRPEFNWQTIKDAVARGDKKLLEDLFEVPYSKTPQPTKLPAGRIELTLDGQGDAKSFHLDLRRAMGRVELEQGRLEVYCRAEEPVGLVRLIGRSASAVIKPAFDVTGQESADQSIGSVASLGYPQPRRSKANGVEWCEQSCAEGFVYVIAAGSRKVKRDMLLAFTVTTNQDAPDPVTEARRRVEHALDEGFAKMRRGHDRYWREFWAKSAVHLGDPAIERHYYLVNYFYGAASRRGAPPIPLQGVWTADDGALPPWKGDYHHDLNTQLTYWPYLGANHLDEGLCFLEFLWKKMPAFRENAQKFYGAPGACVPGVMTLDGRQMGGWHMYSCSPTNGIWVAHNFHRHWRYTMDRAYLEQVAYPFCLENARCIEALLTLDPNGKLKLPLSSSPETHDNRLSAWVKPNSNYDLALMRWLFGALVEMANELGDHPQAAHWTKALSQMDDLAFGPQRNPPDGSHWGVDATLYVAPGEPLLESHRHFSHLMAIHPLGTLHVEGSDRDRQVIDGSLRVIDHFGFPFWCGYSFAWMACMTARCGRGERAWTMLKLYLDTTVSRNGFHLNGDFKQLGVLAPTYRPFTLEGNFAAAEAVHEMLLQGWGDRLRLFPAVPPQWRNVSFANLRTEGAFLVSAWRKDGEFVRAEILSEKGMPVRLQHPHPARPVAVRVGGKQRRFAPARDICFETKSGERYLLETK